MLLMTNFEMTERKFGKFHKKWFLDLPRAMPIGAVHKKWFLELPRATAGSQKIVVYIFFESRNI